MIAVVLPTSAHLDDFPAFDVMLVRMRTVFLLALAVWLPACASANPEPPVTVPASSEPLPATAPASDRAAAMWQAQIAAAQGRQDEQAIADKARADEASRQAADRDRQQAAQAAEDRARAPELAAALRKTCSETRDRRVAHDKAMVLARLDVGIKLMRNANAVRAVCKIVDKRTGSVSVERSGSGWRVTPEMADDLKCSGALPKGVTKDDAYLVLANDRAGQKLLEGAMLETEDHAPEDSQCASSDAEVGLDTSAPQWGDGASIDRLVKWKPKP